MTDAEEKYCTQCPSHADCEYIKTGRPDRCKPLGYYGEGYAQAVQDLTGDSVVMKTMTLIRNKYTKVNVLHGLDVVDPDFQGFKNRQQFKVLFIPVEDNNK